MKLHLRFYFQPNSPCVHGRGVGDGDDDGDDDDDDDDG